jgi:hypothetical protein
MRKAEKNKAEGGGGKVELKAKDMAFFPFSAFRIPTSDFIL